MDLLSLRRELFGMNMGWDLNQWTSSDDSVRGGKSKSSLENRGTGVRFSGILDIDTLGGAGFASQRTESENRCWDLSPFAGLEVSIDPSPSDDKVYTLIFKDEILPCDPVTGRQRSTVSWEFNFSKSMCRPSTDHFSPTTTSVYAPWDCFKPTFRGKPSDKHAGLDLSSLKRVSIMIRSFFGSQQGEFELHIISVVATSSPALTESSPTVASRRDGRGGDATGHRATREEKATQVD